MSGGDFLLLIVLVQGPMIGLGCWLASLQTRGRVALPTILVVGVVLTLLYVRVTS